MNSHHVLVTGGCGFIGSTLVRLLTDRGDRVTVLDALTYAGRLENLRDVQDRSLLNVQVGDICNRSFVRDVCQSNTFTAVIHLAAQTHVDRSIKSAEQFVRTNVLGTQILLDEITQYWTALPQIGRSEFRFVHVSTDEVFGSLGPDGYFTEISTYRPRSPYAASKAAADHLVASWFHTYKLPAITTYSGNNYGPRQYPEKLIPLVIKRALSGEAISIYGSGKNVRDWIHVDDHAQGLLAALDRGTPGSAYCLSARDEQTNLEVVDLVLSALSKYRPRSSGNDYRKLINFVPDRPGHDWRYAMDPDKAERELRFLPRHRMETSILEVVRSYSEDPA